MHSHKDRSELITIFISRFSSDEADSTQVKSRAAGEARKKQNNSVSNIQMPGGYTTQILAKLSLISGTHAPVNRRPEHILIFANVLSEPYLQTPPRDPCK